jgi:hypothetical protein
MEGNEFHLMECNQIFTFDTRSFHYTQTPQNEFRSCASYGSPMDSSLVPPRMGKELNLSCTTGYYRRKRKPGKSSVEEKKITLLKSFKNECNSFHTPPLTSFPFGKPLHME